MAAPLPNGDQVPIFQQAPSIGDPRNYASDPAAAMAHMQAGLKLGEEMANLDNKESERQLKALEIKLSKSKNDLEAAQIADARLKLPTTLGQQFAEAMAKSQAATQASKNALANSTALAAQGVPQAEATLAGLTVGNATNTATANQPNSKLSSIDQAGALSQSQAYGNAAGGAFIARGSMLPEGAAAGMQEAALAKARGWVTTLESYENPATRNVESIPVTRDATGAVVKRGEPVGIVKLGVDNKTASQAAKESTSILQAKQIANELDALLLKFSESGKAGLLQANATNVANAPVTPGLRGAISGTFGQVARAMQSPEVKELSQKAASLNNFLANSLFGQALSKEESARLNAQVPTVYEAVADPKSAAIKLKGVIGDLDAKMTQLKDRGALIGGAVDRPSQARTPAAPKADAKVEYVGQPVFNQRAQAWYQEIKVNGVLGTIPVKPPGKGK
jgi:hypothetical protein